MVGQKNKFKSYFKELDCKFDKSRLEQEIIYYIEKFDINEEIIRLKHHLKFFSSEMKRKENKGKKLSFIAQHNESITCRHSILKIFSFFIFTTTH